MSGAFVSTQIQRGLQLREVRRFREAEAAFKEALALDPENDFVLHQLALTHWQQNNTAAALAAISQAVRIAPTESDHHGLHALITAEASSPKNGLEFANEAIRQDPTSAFAHAVRAQIHLQMRRLTAAESDARAALSIDPSHNGAATVLSHALRLQGRTAENEDQIASMLRRDPHDPDNHCAAGWNALQAGDYRKAQVHFIEALRLNPESEFARDGLIEAFRARSSLYRIYLRWSLWMQSKSAATQWGIVFGLLIAVRYSRHLFTGALAPIAICIALLYLLFMLWVHVARGVGNFMLLCDKFARIALRTNEKWEAWMVGGGIAVAAVAGSVGALFHELPLLILAGTLIAAALPFAYTFTNRSRPGRFVFGSIGAFVLAAGGVLLGSLKGGRFMSEDFAATVGISALIASVASTWLCGVPSLNRR